MDAFWVRRIVFIELVVRTCYPCFSTGTISDDHKVLPETISKEPLGPVVRQGDSVWEDIVRWSLNTMIIAEEFNITSANVDDNMSSNIPEVLRILGVEGGYGEMLELSNDFAYNITNLPLFCHFHIHKFVIIQFSVAGSIKSKV